MGKMNLSEAGCEELQCLVIVHLPLATVCMSSNRPHDKSIFTLFRLVVFATITTRPPPMSRRTAPPSRRFERGAFRLATNSFR
jgi:hypothetical protein